ncbi:MAG: hypothetical protein KDC92_10455 [Bacteroidetes bacterium]|nr:hypothetical protein [Bacteroidota bacterium]
MLFVLAAQVSAQQNEENNTPAFGLVYNTILTTEILSGERVESTVEDVLFSYNSAYSQGFGGFITFSPYQTFSFSTGITTIRRNYQVFMDADSFDFERKLRVNSFQVPLLGVVNVQLGNNLWISGRGGFVLEFFPNNQLIEDERFLTVTQPRYWAIPTLRGGARLEYTTPKNGAFFIGASYTRSLTYLVRMYMDYSLANRTITENFKLEGHYFSLDVGYVFARKQ